MALFRVTIQINTPHFFTKMVTKTNAKAVTSTLGERLKSDSAIVGSFGKLAAFAALAASGEPMSLLAGITHLSEAAGAALEGASEVASRLNPTEGAVNGNLSNFDRFKALFFTSCARSYIEAIDRNIKFLSEQVEKRTENTLVAAPKAVPQSLHEKLTLGIARLSETEVSFLYGVQPLSGALPLFKAYGEWLAATLMKYGFQEKEIREFTKICEKEARERFTAYLSGSDEVATWMRNYLAVFNDDKLSSVSDGLKSILDSLEQWIEPQRNRRNNKEEAWKEYRVTLQALPDMKETMFNEQFGVRKVFVRPQVAYHIAGGLGETGRPQQSTDIGRLLGALVSTRTTGEDLIILCGGPGSGKSTLCRVLAAQLASNDELHPVFIRLRRLKEGSDIGAFIEDTLQKIGAIDRLSDLKDFSNLVIILDGFDELVMASRARLRQFFNVLREEHSTGALRGAKIIVSGRDTLFPNGEGLPNGSHVLTLLPFDKARVEAWGAKWREMHETGVGATFTPEQFLDASKHGTKGSPLHHLVSWPLTLHLIARVHTAGLLNLSSGDKKNQIAKAYLYRSILAETAERQLGQADTQDRLKPERMRDFLRDLAWQMYAEAKDSMDPSEVMPILSKYFTVSEAELSELADVAVVNSPELTKGEETGFEFVHKSFSEYLVAEKLARSVEMVIFQAPSFGSDELTWRMSEQEAARELAPYLAIRLLTEEVQEMLEPILGNLNPFLKGERVSESVSSEVRNKGLMTVVERFESLFRQNVIGEDFDAVVSTIAKRQFVQNPLEAVANYAAGIVLVGAAAVRQLRFINKSGQKARLFECNSIDGGFWRWICTIHAGGIQIDRKLAFRLFDGATVRGGGDRVVSDISTPVKLGWLDNVNGYDASLTTLVRELVGTIQYLQLALIGTALSSATKEIDHSRPFRIDSIKFEFYPDNYFHDSSDIDLSRLLEPFFRSGLLSDNIMVSQLQHFEYLMRRIITGRNNEEIGQQFASVANELQHTLGYFPNGRRHVGALLDLAKRLGGDVSKKYSKGFW